MLLWSPPQVVLSNIAMIAENGTVLFECKLPEEFLLAKTMRLSPVRIAGNCGPSLPACEAINAVLQCITCHSAAHHRPQPRPP